MIGATHPVGFVENSSDPDDLQASCQRCEILFAEEQALTERFEEFCAPAVVCVSCYAELKDKHSTPGS
jgi:hypothetical protein